MGKTKKDVVKDLIRNRLEQGGNTMDEATIAALLKGGTGSSSSMDKIMEMMMMKMMMEGMNGSKKDDDMSMKDIMQMKIMMSMLDGDGKKDMESLIAMMKPEKDSTPESIINMMEKMMESNKDKVDSSVMAVINPLVNSLQDISQRVELLSAQVQRPRERPTRSLEPPKNGPIEAIKTLRELSGEIDSIRGVSGISNAPDPETAKIAFATKQADHMAGLKKEQMQNEAELLRKALEGFDSKLEKGVDAITSMITNQQEAQLRGMINTAPATQAYPYTPAPQPPTESAPQEPPVQEQDISFSISPEDMAELEKEAEAEIQAVEEEEETETLINEDSD